MQQKKKNQDFWLMETSDTLDYNPIASIVDVNAAKLSLGGSIPLPQLSFVDISLQR